MILSIIALSQAVSMPRLVEYPRRGEELVAIEALIKLPKLEPGHRFRLEQAAINAVKMTPQYGRRDISRILAPGTRFRIDQLSDTLRLGLTVEPKDIGAGLSVLSSVLTQPTFLPDAIKVDMLPSNASWLRATRAYETVAMDVDQPVLQDVWKYVVQPTNITVGVRGAFVEGQAKVLWSKREQFWNEYVPNKSVYGRSAKLKLEIGDPPILLLRSPIGVLTPEHVLDATLLGGGKDSVLWRVCREQLRMSYQQDAFLLPTEAGWEFRLAVATDKRIFEEGAVESVKATLLKAIDQLAEKDLDHARGLLKGYFEYGQSGLPITLGSIPLTTGDSNDILFRDLYFESKKLQPFEAKTWISDSNLDAAKKRLRSLLDGAAVSFR